MLHIATIFDLLDEITRRSSVPVHYDPLGEIQTIFEADLLFANWRPWLV